MLLCLCKQGSGINIQLLQRILVVQEFDNLLDAVGNQDIQIVHHSRLVGIFARYDDTLQAHLTGQDGKRQTSPDGLHMSVERKFAHHHIVGQLSC